MAKAQEITKNNSTETALGGGGVFTGVADDVSRLSTISIFMEADKDGTLSIQVSADQENWQSIKEISFKMSDKFLIHQEPTTARWVRMVYTNGGTEQTYFRLQTIYHLYKSAETESAINQLAAQNEGNDILAEIREHGKTLNSISELLIEQKITNKLLKKIYNPE